MVAALSAPFQAPKGNARQRVRESDGLSRQFISEFNVGAKPNLKFSPEPRENRGPR